MLRWIITLIALHTLFHTSPCKAMYIHSGEYPDTIIIEHEPPRMKFKCQVQSHYDVDIEPLTTGHLQLLNYTQGEMVQQGQLLFRVDPSKHIEELRSAESALLAAQSRRTAAQKLYDHQCNTPQHKAKSRTKRNSTNQNLAIARAEVNRAKLRLRQAKAALLGTEFHAPFSGIIGQTQGSIGEHVGTGTEFEVVNTLSNIDSVFVTITIPTEHYIQIAMRDSARQMLYNDKRTFTDITLHLDNGADHPHKGHYKFTLRSSETENNNRSNGVIIIHILFANPLKALRPGDKVTLSARIGDRKNAIFIPHHSLVQSNNSIGVYHLGRDGKITHRTVELGGSFGDKWEVVQGLNPGDMILCGNSNLTQ